MSQRTAEQTLPALGAAAGILGILIPSVGVAVLPIWQFPATTASATDIVDFVSAHRSPLQLVMVLNTVGVTLWLVFGVRVWNELRRTPRGGEAAGWFLAGLVGFVTLLLSGFTTFDVLVYRPPPPDTARVLYDLTFGLLAMSGMPTAVALGAFAIAVYLDRPAMRYTAHLAVLAGVAHLLLLLSFVIGEGFLSLEGQVITVVPAFLWAWILATAISLARRPRETA